jgi:hypothetical protein
MATSGSVYLQLYTKTISGYGQSTTYTHGVTFSWERTDYTIGTTSTSTITWSLTPSGSFDGSGTREYDFTVKIDGSSAGTGTVGFRNVSIVSGGTTGTKTFTHTSNGTKSFTVDVSCVFDKLIGSDDVYNTSQTFTLDSLASIATISSADNFNDEENPTITYSNPTGNLVDGLLVGIGATDGSMLVSYRAVTKTSTSYTFNLSEAERNALIRQIRTGKTTTVRFYLRTKIGSTYYDKYVSRTLTLVNYEPILDPTIPIDTNSATIALTGDDSILVRSYSNVYVETGAEARKGATITSQYIINGSTTVNAGSATFNNIESNEFKYSVTDSRGYTTTDTLEVTLIPYFKPTISLSVLPFSLAGDLTFTLKGKYFNNSFGARDNSFAVSYVIVESGQSLSTATYQNVPRSASTIVGDDYSTNYTISGLDPNKSYQLMVRIQDSLDASYASRQSIAAAPLFDWSRVDFNFNVPVYLKDTEIPLENLKDYVVLQGTSGDWFYRLWYSGKVELFGTKDIYGVACNSALGGWYRTAVQSSPQYPFTINNAIVTVNYESDGYGAVVWPTTQSTTSKPFDFYLIRPTSSTGITGKLTYHVIGDLGGVIA